MMLDICVAAELIERRLELSLHTMKDGCGDMVYGNVVVGYDDYVPISLTYDGEEIPDEALPGLLTDLGLGSDLARFLEFEVAYEKQRRIAYDYDSDGCLTDDERRGAAREMKRLLTHLCEWLPDTGYWIGGGFAHWSFDNRRWLEEEEIERDVLGWHWLPADRLLTNGDGRLVIDGETLTVQDPEAIALYEYGMHASLDVLDSLRYAAGPILCRVRMGGNIEYGDDKLVASERTVLWSIDMTDHLWPFARWAALQVIHLWDAPAVVRQFLETGDESLWVAAWAAAGAAAWATSRDDAWEDAGPAARAAALAAAGPGAWPAARAAAWDAMRNQQREKLLSLVELVRASSTSKTLERTS